MKLYKEIGLSNVKDKISPLEMWAEDWTVMIITFKYPARAIENKR